RTTGAPPGPADSMLRTVTGERVMVKESFPVNPEPGQNGIIECCLHHVGVLAVHIEMNHPVSPPEAGDCSAGFRIAVEVWQIVVFGESLVLGVGPDPAGNVEFRVAEILPERFAKGK